MNDRFNEFKKKLFASGIVEEQELVGCSCEELIEIEEKSGKLPTSYKQVMQLLGKRACPLIGREWDFYIDDIRDFNIENYPIDREELDKMNIDKNIFWILARYGEARHFIWTNDESEDAPVFEWTIDDKFKEVNSSIWEWMEYWIIDAQEMIKLREKSKPALIKMQNKYKRRYIFLSEAIALTKNIYVRICLTKLCLINNQNN